ncbi:MAG: PKD domain-containing protein [Bacteroidales bacterium]|nr:PKD domain-containing protein [Bacteroidales bacterium]
MKYRSVFFGSILLIICLFTFNGFSQTVTELVVPMYFGSKTASSTNNARTAFAVCLQIDGLTANTTYDIKPGVGLVTEAGTVYGAGNAWNGTTFTGTTNLTSYFTTDGSGSSGPFWVFIQPTGNASRFDAGQQHNIRLGWVVTGGSMPGSPLFVGTKTLTALDIAVSERTPVTTDDGCFVKGSSLAASNGKYMLMYDNVSGTGDPLFSYMIMPSIPTQPSNSELPAPVNDIYMQSGTAVAGDYPAVIPIGANNPNGVRRVESRNPDNTIFAFNTSASGIWPSGANTTTALRRDVVTLTNSDTPLTPSGPGLPSVSTSTVVNNISFNSATGGGNVTNTGGSAISARGLCWGTGINPTIAGAHTVEPGTLGPFVSNMTGLQPGTTYHLRAYATNTTGTAYGADVSFSTLCGVVAPLPDFSASKVNLMVGEAINFFDSTQFCPTAWNWSFNGGTPATSTLQNPTGIAYNFAGDYTVCLTASNEWGQNTTCKAAYIHVIGPTNAPIVITEINYRSPLGGTDSLEFIELYNNGAQSVDLAGFYFSKGIEFTFPAVLLNPHAYVMVSKSASLITATYGVPSFQWNAGSALSNGGEPVVLKDLFGFVVDSVYYLPILPWDTMANGKGPTLELCDPNSNNLLPANWRHAIEYQAMTSSGDSLWASPLAGCAYLPVANFIASDSAVILGQSVIFTDASLGDITSWFWEFERGYPETFSGQTPPPISYNIMGAYDVTLTVRNDAGKSVKYKPAFIQVGAAGISTRLSKPNFSVVPNPANSGNFSIIIESGASFEIQIFSGVGSLVESRVTDTTENVFNLSDIAKGIYLIQVNDHKTGYVSTQKLIIQ